MDKETYKRACELTATLDIADADLRHIRTSLDEYLTPMEGTTRPRVKILHAEIHVQEREQTSDYTWSDGEVIYQIDKATLIETLKKQAYKLEQLIKKAKEEFDNL